MASKKQQNAMQMDPQRFQMAKNMSVVPGGPMNNNPEKCHERWATSPIDEWHDIESIQRCSDATPTNGCRHLESADG